jgi:hypothetical protein
MLQESGPDGSAANLIASIERTSEAMRLRAEETNIAI